MAKEDRGFASMDRAKQREIASKGGKAAHQKGTAHEWTSEEAREAGRKGGMASHRRKQQAREGGERQRAGEGRGGVGRRRFAHLPAHFHTITRGEGGDAPRPTFPVPHGVWRLRRRTPLAARHLPLRDTAG